MEIKTKADLLDAFVQIAISKGYSDYSGDAERLINETVHMYENLPNKNDELKVALDALEEISDTDAMPVDEYDYSCGYEWEEAIKHMHDVADKAIAVLEKEK
mgnify:CR=1 FL=1